jgi:hypothetical protein
VLSTFARGNAGGKTYGRASYYRNKTRRSVIGSEYGRRNVLKWPPGLARQSGFGVSRAVRRSADNRSKNHIIPWAANASIKTIERPTRVLDRPFR